jgi:hypothetical protein
VGSTAGNGRTSIDFPTGTHGERLQLRVTITPNTRVGYDSTSPRLLYLLVRYIERPNDARGFSSVYQLDPHGVWVNGSFIGKSIPDWLTDLTTLREATVPLTWYPAWGEGASYQCHMVTYDGGITVVDNTPIGRKYRAWVVVRLQVV